MATEPPRAAACIGTCSHQVISRASAASAAMRNTPSNPLAADRYAACTTEPASSGSRAPAASSASMISGLP